MLKEKKLWTVTKVSIPDLVFSCGRICSMSTRIRNSDWFLSFKIEFSLWVWLRKYRVKCFLYQYHFTKMKNKHEGYDNFMYTKCKQKELWRNHFRFLQLWYLYKMVTQSILHLHDGKKVFGLIKCLKQIKYHRLLLRPHLFLSYHLI